MKHKVRMMHESVLVVGSWNQFKTLKPYLLHLRQSRISCDTVRDSWGKNWEISFHTLSGSPAETW